MNIPVHPTAMSDDFVGRRGNSQAGGGQRSTNSPSLTRDAAEPAAHRIDIVVDSSADPDIFV
jgi:hypothetical protein